MTYRLLVVLFALLVAILFFRGATGSFSLKEVFSYRYSFNLFIVSAAFILLIVIGAGVVREGLTIQDVLFLS